MHRSLITRLFFLQIISLALIFANGCREEDRETKSADTPKGLTATSDLQLITISWEPGAGNAVGYRIAHQTGEEAPADCSSGTLVDVDAALTTSHQLSDLDPGFHAFRLCSVNAAGDLSEGTTVTAYFSTSTFKELSLGKTFSCGLKDDGKAYCWGYGYYGRLGNEKKGSSATYFESTAVAVSGDHTFQSLSAGEEHSCGLKTDGSVYCWGSGMDGMLGNGTDTQGFYVEYAPVAVVDSDGFQSVSVGAGHSCGLKANGSAYCWGGGSDGRLGNGKSGYGEYAITPMLVAGPQDYQTLVVGGYHTCGLRPGGAAYCWGYGSNGRLGNNAKEDQLTPVAVAGGLSFTSIALGSTHTCGLTAEGTAYCFGQGKYGQLGTGSIDDKLTPAAVAGGHSFQSLSVGSNHTCGLKSNGSAYCWGRGSSSQLGNDDLADQLSPVAVAGGHSFIAIEAGAYHTCALKVGGAALCWGRGQSGRLGNGQVKDQASPGIVF